jgi:hypothetical protein
VTSLLKEVLDLKRQKHVKLLGYSRRSSAPVWNEIDAGLSAIELLVEAPRHHSIRVDPDDRI